MILAGATGAVLGDNVSYWLGHFVGEKHGQALVPGEKAHQRLRVGGADARRARRVHHHHRPLHPRRPDRHHVLGRLHPDVPWRRFIVYDIAAGILWATYAALLGYFGGKTFENHPFFAVLIALGFALESGS